MIAWSLWTYRWTMIDADVQSSIQSSNCAQSSFVGVDSSHQAYMISRFTDLAGSYQALHAWIACTLTIVAGLYSLAAKWAIANVPPVSRQVLGQLTSIGASTWTEHFCVQLFARSHHFVHGRDPADEMRASGCGHDSQNPKSRSGTSKIY